MVQAIETVYNGYKFRSRLEARFAKLFDCLGVRYEYEKEGYKLQHGWYLPDFWLLDFDAWFEVKGKRPTDQESALAFELAHATDKLVYLAYGEIPYPVVDIPNDVTDSMEIYLPDGGYDNQYYFCECVYCGSIGIQFNGRSDRLPCKNTGCPKSSHGDKGYAYGTWRLVQAYESARQARFEYWGRP